MLRQMVLQSVERCGLQCTHKIAIHTHIYNILTFEWEVVLGSRGHDRGKYDEIFRKRTMRVSAIGIFLRNLPKKDTKIFPI